MNVNKTLVALALSSTLAACGSDSSAPTPEPPTQDTTAPVITLSGNSTLDVAYNSTYTDAGATANDAVDGPVTVTVTGTVDTSTAGDYTITYTATDAAGNVETETRTVTVIAPVETIVAGKAIKGVLTNAVVTVYKFDESGTAVLLTDDELADANIVTDDAGNYTFTVLDYDGPIKVVLSPSTDPASPTTMTCDAPAGCGDTAFGAEIDLTAADPTFELAAISVVDADSEEEVKVNVSALTHLASVLIEESDAGVTTESVADESSKIATTFGITGDITTLEPTVTTDSQAVIDADDDALKYGLINAGIMEALFSGETDDANVLSDKLGEVATDLVVNDGALLVNQDEDEEGFELALADVLEGAGDAASAAADAIANDDTLTGTEEILADLAQEETNLENDKIAEEALVGDDGFSQVGTDEPTDGDAIAKGKAMVDDVRLFSHLFDVTSTEGAGVKTQGDEYIALMEAAGVMIEAEANSFTLLAQISEALANITLDLDEGTLDSAAGGVNIADYLELGDATGTITFNENTTNGGVLFSINASANAGAELVTLNASAEFTGEGMSITLNIDGSIESSGAKFTLATGSKAVINLSSAASRVAFDDDTFEGDIVSGELKLDIELMQKATDTVTNPITFSGMLDTDLQLVGERALDERWEWDAQSQQDVRVYGPTEIDDAIFPEMLSLSGEFSALEGDLIKAALTVNINNLDGYQAPEFKYIGKEVADVVAITISEDLNTVIITDADSVSDEQQTIETRVFTTGTQVGEWSATSSVVATNPEEHYWTTGIERKIVTSVDDQGVLLYTRVFKTGEAEPQAGFKSIRVTPVHQDGDGTADAYQFDLINHRDGKDYDFTSFATIMDTDGNILTSDGAHTWDSAQNKGEWSSIAEFIDNNPGQFIANPLTVNNGAELLAQTITNWWGNQKSYEIVDQGVATIFFDEEALENIAAGDFSELPPTAYLTQALIKDAVTVVVSADANTVTSSTEGAFVSTRTYTGAVGSDFTFTSENVFDGGGTDTLSVSSMVNSDNGLDIPEVIVSQRYENSWNVLSSKIKFVPVDDQAEGDAGFGEADRVEVYYIGNWGHDFDDAGNLVDDTGSIVEFTDSSWKINEFSSYADFDWSSNSWEAYGAVWWNPLPFNPLTVENVLDVYKGYITNEWGYNVSANLDGIGKIEIDFSDEDLAAITAGSTTMFDAYNTEADDRYSLEDDETFLDVNAALTLEAMLGDYEVRVQLSGDRTALDDGTFDLEMVYRLPGDEAQRSFTAHADTEQDDTLTITNTEDVTVTITEISEDDANAGESVLGTIVVGTGEEAVQVGQIVDRDGLILIVYTDGVVESL